MTSRPRHARKTPRHTHTLLRVGLTVSAAGAALAGAGSAAVAAQPSQVETPVGALDTSMVHQPTATLGDSVGHATDGSLGTVQDMQANPLAGTGVDPTDNAVGTKLGDSEPVGTEAVTAPLSSGDSLGELPGIGVGQGALDGGMPDVGQAGQALSGA